MAIGAFYTRFGFIADPFQSTNASDEPLLESYFVPPPYFTSVLGDTERPKSQVILAPRGGGKTAQRVMIEKQSAADSSFLCITYDTFDVPRTFQAADATWEYHMIQINRLLIVAILVTLEADAVSVDALSNAQKQLIKFGIEKLLGTFSAQEFEDAVNSLKNFGDRAREVWKKYGGVFAVLLAAAMHKFGLGDVKLPAELVAMKRDESLRYQFRQFLGVIRALGYRSTYILVDRVDELSITSKNATSSEAFIDSLVTDLPTLEEPSVAFKFFLWDQIKQIYLDRGARPDRIQIFELNWNIGELSSMLTERLKAYSENKVASLNLLVCGDVDLDLQKLVCHFAAGSPRDMIRICKTIVDEQTRITADEPCITEASIWQALRVFCNERSAELYGDLAPLRRTSTLTFTINQLASDVFRQETQSVRARVQGWQNTGAVARIGDVPNPGSRPMYLYGVDDMRLAVAMLQAEDVPTILSSFILECPNCKSITISDRAEITCPSCRSAFRSEEARSILAVCARGDQ